MLRRFLNIFLIAYYILLPTALVAIMGYLLISVMPPSKVRIEAGPRTGFFANSAEVIAQELWAFGIDTQIEYVDDTTKIIDRVNAGDADIGFVAQSLAHTRTDHVFSLGAIAIEPMWFFAKAESGINHIAQLKGKTIAVGPQGSGARILGTQILNLYGITSQNSEFLPLRVRDRAIAINEGGVDASLFLFPETTPLIQALSKNPRLTLIDIPEADALSRMLPNLQKVTIPRGAFAFMPPSPSQQTDSVAIPVSIVMNSDAGSSLGVLVADILKRKFSARTLFTDDNELPAFYYRQLEPLRDAENIYTQGRPFLSDIFGVKYGLILTHAAGPFLFVAALVVILLSTLSTFLRFPLNILDVVGFLKRRG